MLLALSRCSKKRSLIRPLQLAHLLREDVGVGRSLQQSVCPSVHTRSTDNSTFVKQYSSTCRRDSDVHLGSNPAVESSSDDHEDGEGVNVNRVHEAMHERSQDTFDDDDEEGFITEDDYSDDEKEEEIEAAIREPKIDEQGRAHGLGRRKTAVAQVWIKRGYGNFEVNHAPLAEYFSRDAHQDDVIQPFYVANKLMQFDVSCRVFGGGKSGQAGAVRLGLARALDNYEPTLRKVLRAAGLMTRDNRMVERKKPGQPKARKKKQWVKR